jgi:DMSO/TMAO reductase YedYZ molybdopterin-dependent catalytic subunit
VRREDWRLTVDGHVRQPLTLAFDDLRTLQGRTVRALLECSGNDAAFFDVEPAGNAPAVFEPLPAGRERPRRADGLLLSAGEFTGMPLAAVLEQAGLGPNAVSVRVEGWDRGSPNPAGHGLPESYAGIPPFNYDKGLPLEKALHPDTLLAWAMNGQYLDHIHGAPLRLVVPGWSGNWSVKWVQRIEVLDRPATCWYQTEYYYFSASPDDPAREMITALPVKSLLTEPDDGATLPRGRRLLRGLAWSGAGTVTGVEVSADGGRTWRAARLEHRSSNRAEGCGSGGKVDRRGRSGCAAWRPSGLRSARWRSYASRCLAPARPPVHRGADGRPPHPTGEVVRVPAAHPP